MKLPEAQVSALSSKRPLPVRLFVAPAIAFACLSLAFVATSPSGRAVSGGEENKHLQLLKKIYDEVKVMTRRTGEDFVKGDFFIGKDDPDDTNKDDHVSVFIQFQGAKDKMNIQITHLEPSQDDARVKIAHDTKSVSCLVSAAGIEMLSSDYKEKNLAKLAADILQAVKDKKKLLREGGIKDVSSSAV